MNNGYIKFKIRMDNGAVPLENARITLYHTNGGIICRTATDKNGNTKAIRLPAPNKKRTSNLERDKCAWSSYSADIHAKGFITKHLAGIPIFDTVTTILPEIMRLAESGDMAVTDEYIEIGESSRHKRKGNAPNLVEPSVPLERLMIPPPAGIPSESEGKEFEDGVSLPEFITVHLGAPFDDSENVRIKFSEYIKNVVSADIYPVWPRSLIGATIKSSVIFVLSRVYGGWYRSQGYDFDITSLADYDMQYRFSGPVFDNIDRMVDTQLRAFMSGGLRNS